MASWKKVIVSGSSAHLANVTSSNLTSTQLVIASTGGALSSSGITLSGGTLALGTTNITSTGGSSILSGSFSGSHFGPLTGTASWAASASQAVTASYAILAQAVVGGSTTPGALFYGAGLTGSATSFNGAVNVTFSLNTGSTAIATNNIPKWSGTGLASSTLSETGTTVTTTGNLIVSGTTTLGDASGDSVTINAATVTIPNVAGGTTDTVIIKDGSNNLATRAIDTRVWGSTLISGSGTNTQVAFFNAGTGITSSAGFTFASSILTTPNLTVTNNLIVQGTASFQETTNLTVADRFILLASGSNSTGEGGIVVQQGTQGVGEVFGWDNDTLRWAVTSSFTANQPTFAPDAFMAAVILGGTDPTTTVARYTKNGNLYIGSDEAIWIYS